MIPAWLPSFGLLTAICVPPSLAQAQPGEEAGADQVEMRLERCVLRWQAGQGLAVDYDGKPVFLPYASAMTVHTRDWTTAHYNSREQRGRAVLTQQVGTHTLVVRHSSEEFRWTETLTAGPGDHFGLEYVYRQDKWDDAALQLGFSRPAEGFFAGAPFETDAARQRDDGRIPLEYDPDLPHPFDQATGVTVNSLFGHVTIKTSKPVSLFDYETRNGAFWLGLDEPLPRGEERSFAIEVTFSPARLELPGWTVSDLQLPSVVDTGRLRVGAVLTGKRGAPARVRLALTAVSPDGEALKAATDAELQPDRSAPIEVSLPTPTPGRYACHITVAALPSGEQLFESHELPVEVLPLLTVLPRLSLYTSEDQTHLLVRTAAGLAGRRLLLAARQEDRTVARAEVVGGGQSRVPLDLTGFPDGTTPLSCQLLDGETVIASAEAKVRKAEPKPNEVKIDYESRGLIVDGLPWFPCGFYCVFPPGDLPQVEAPQGFNMIAPYQSWPNEQRPDHYDEVRAYLDRCASLGMKVHYDIRTLAQSEPSDAKWETLKREVEAFRDHPALLTWYLCDEPAGQGIPPERLKEAYEFIKRLDPYHPITMVFCVPDKAPEYADAMDILMADPYPIPNHPVTLVADWTDNLNRATGRAMPLWIVPQAFGGGEGWGREPSAREERAMTYLALVHGATGIQYFIRRAPVGNPISPSLWSECRRLALEIGELAPVLLSADEAPAATCSDAGIHVATRRYRGAAYLIAVNTSSAPAEADFTVDGGYTGDAQVAFEQRAVAVVEGKLTDIIDGFGTRVYRMVTDLVPDAATISPANLTLNPSFEQAANVGTPDGCYVTVGADQGASLFVDPRLAHHGSHSLRLTTPAEGKGLTVAPFPIRVQQGTTYDLSIWARSSRPGMRFELAAHALDPGLQAFDLTTEWSEYAFSGVAKSDGRSTMSLKLVSEGSAWFDLLQVVPR